MNSSIDDPIESARRQFPPHEPNPVFEAALTVSGLAFGPLGSAVRASLERFGDNQPERLEYFVEVVMDEVQRHQRQLDDIRKRLSDAEAPETILIALERVTRTQSRERIERFGRVFGTALSSDHIDWDETRAFLYDLERLTDQDIETLRVVDTDGGKIRSDQNHAEFQSRCGRLGGFGLVALEVLSLYGGSEQSYTTSRRGKWLLSALALGGERTP